MNRTLLIVAAVGLLAFQNTSNAETARTRIPELSGYNLEGAPLALPADLDERATLLVILDGSPPADDLSGWRAAAAELEAEVPVLFLIMMGEKSGLARSISAGSLRRDIRNKDLWARLVPVFQDGSELRKLLEVSSSSRVSAVLVNRTGDILWRARGPAGEMAVEEIKTHALSDLPYSSGAIDPASAAVAKVDIPLPGPTAPADVSPPALTAQAKAALPEGAEPRFPELTGVTLAGRTVSLPVDLAEAGSRLVLLSDYVGDAAVITALTGQGLPDEGVSPVDYVLLFMGRSPRFGKAIAAGQLRSRFKSDTLRQRILPIYMDLSEFERLANLEAGEQAERTVLVTRRGAVSVIHNQY